MEITVFNNTEFGEIRTVMLNEEPYFVGKDVAAVLGYADTFGALKKHVDEEDKQNCQNDSFESPRGLTVINESGLYSLILSSKLPSAKRFKHWVTSEVLPSIRKHGAYMTDDVLQKALTSPDFLIELATKLKAEKAKTAQLTVDNQIMQPKAEYFDMLVDRNLLTNFRDTAKELGVKPKAFVNFLLDKGYIYRSAKGKIKPYAQYVDDGIFQLKEFTNDKTGYSDTQTLITPKGRETFRLLCI